jgi:hypothetical protein
MTNFGVKTDKIGLIWPIDLAQAAGKLFWKIGISNCNLIRFSVKHKIFIKFARILL